MSISQTGEVTIRPACFPGDAAGLKELVREYFSWLELPTTHRGFAEELENLEIHYTPPSGVFLLLVRGDGLLGCVALLSHGKEVAEVKRLYVRQQYRGMMFGESLMSSAIEEARTRSFQELILGAIPKTTSAQALYRKLGFTGAEPFYPDPPEGTSFYKLSL